MTTKEKAEEITNKHLNEWISEFIEYNNLSKDDRNQIRFKLYNACNEIAEWEHERLVEKVCEWLKKNRNELSRIDTSKFIEIFKREIKK